MKVEFDQKEIKTVLHLNAEETGTVLFALYMLSANSYSKKDQSLAASMYNQINESTDQ